MLKKNILNLALLYSIVLFVASLISLNTGVSLKTGSDKVFHFVAHFLLVIFWFLAFNIKLNVKKNRALLQSFVFSLCFGILIEVSQELFTTTREADVKDVVANVIGAILGGLVVHLISKKQIKI